jgi:hypothetical protein
VICPNRTPESHESSSYKSGQITTLKKGKKGTRNITAILKTENTTSDGLLESPATHKGRYK